MVFRRYVVSCATLLIVYLNLIAVRAETFYVAQCANASDKNDGTSLRPLRSISLAVQRAHAGDSVIVYAGDYRQEDTGWGTGVIPVVNSGTKSAPIRIRTAWGARPLVSRMLLKKCAYIAIEGFQFSGMRFQDVAGWREMPEIVRDRVISPRPDYTQSWQARQSQVKAEFETYFNLIEMLDFATAIDMENCSDIKLTNNLIDGYWAGMQCRHCENMTIAWNQISHCVNGIFAWRPAPALVDSDIRGNIISHSLDNGIDVREYSHNVRVDQNFVTLSGRSHISLMSGVSNSRVHNNVVSYGGYYSESMEDPGSSAINVHSSLAGNTIQWNLASYQLDLTEIDGNGIILDLMKDGSSVTVKNNVSWRNMGDGLNTTSSPNAIILQNTFLENGYGAQGYRRGAGIKLSRDQDVQQTILYNNLWFNRAAGIMAYHIIDKQKSIDGNYYNTIDSPMIWDGYAEDDRIYNTLTSIRSNTPWERRGWGASLFWK